MIYHFIEGHMVGRPIFDAAARRAAGLCRAARIRFLTRYQPQLRAGLSRLPAIDLWRICAICPEICD